MDQFSWWSTAEPILAMLFLPASIYALYDLITDEIPEKWQKWRDYQIKKILYGKQKHWIIASPVYDKYFARIEDIEAIRTLREWGRTRKMDFEEVFDDIEPLSGHHYILVCAHFFENGKQTISGALDARNVFQYKICRNPKLGDKNGELLKDGQGHILPAAYIEDRRTHPSTLYISPMDNVGDAYEANTDYVLIGRYEDKTIDTTYIVCWGIHGIGSLGGAHFLTANKNVIKSIKGFKGENFEAICKVTTNAERTEYLSGGIVCAPRSLHM